MNTHTRKIKILISAVMILFVLVPAAHSNPKKRKHDVIQNSPCFYYTIKKGDTLWDLSRRFYNSNWVWPGLWGINGEIKNPHVIYPGEKIKIFLKKTVKELPAKKTKIKKPEIVVTFFYPETSNLDFIATNRVKPLGDILKSREGKVMISQPDTVYIERIKNRRIIPGKKYTIFSTKKIIYKYNKKKLEGVKHIIKGVVKITKNNGEYFTGKITRSFHYIAKGDMLMKQGQACSEIRVKKPLKNINAQIICSDNGNTIIGDHEIAFINSGSFDNVKPGQIYNIFKRQDPIKSRVTGKALILTPVKIGKLIVLRTKKAASTVMVLSALKPIRSGDIVHY